MVLHGGTGPGELDKRITPPAVAEDLRCVEYLEPADGDEVFPGSFDVPEIHMKDVGNPGSFAPAAADAAVLAVVEAADEVPEDGGDHGRAAAAGDEAHDLAGHGHAAGMVRDRLIHGVEGREVMQTPYVDGGGRKSELGRGPGEQARGFEAADGSP